MLLLSDNVSSKSEQHATRSYKFVPEHTVLVTQFTSKTTQQTLTRAKYSGTYVDRLHHAFQTAYAVYAGQYNEGDLDRY